MSLSVLLLLQDRSQLGGRNAAMDAMAGVAALCSAPEPVIAEGACNAVLASGGLEPMVQVRGDGLWKPVSPVPRDVSRCLPGDAEPCLTDL